ncbi:zinc finger protein ZAT9-like [Primulina eburnea]|uniref:zinc finger protein ZAT9-like n=1 Tax=Primulina eburnea TaxID=1245227 RepID=UPI003C6C06E3
MDNHRCKLCFRRFANGKALGGHMRSHTMNFRSSSSEEEAGEKSGLLSSLFSVPKESETEKHFICTRSEMVGQSRISTLNRIRMDGFFVDEEKIKIDPFFPPFSDPEYLSSSVDAAHCLIMLSRDKRRRDEIEYQTEEKEKKFEDDYSVDSCEEKVMKNKVRAKYYRCEICSKLFRSFQALGGHRASHNKVVRVNTRDSSGGPKPTAALLERTVACPFCPRVFASGQAFGGHKRTHFIAATATTTSPAKPFSRNGECFDIDLNLPASFDDEVLMHN